MPTFQLTVTLTQDGVALPGFPLTSSSTVDETTGRFTVERATGGGYVATPDTDIGAVNVFYLTSNEAVTVRFNDQTDGGLPLNASGVLIAVGSNIPSGATTKISIDNSSGNEATITGLLGGT